MRGVWDRPWTKLEAVGTSILVGARLLRDLAILIEVISFCVMS